MKMKLPQKCFVVTTRNPKSLYALHTKTATRLLCFKNIAQAEQCESSLSLYRKKYGKWPRRLIQNNSFNDVELSNENQPSLTECKNLLEIQYADTEGMVEFCKYAGIGLIMCDTFDVSHGQLHVKGVQIHEPVHDIEDQKMIFENVYNES